MNKIDEAFGFQNQVDCMVGACTINLANKNVCSAQNSLVNPSVSTAGEYAVNGVLVSNAAASSAFPITPDTTIPIGAGAAFVCCFNAAGSGIAYPTNVLTSAQVSTLGATCAVVLASDDLIMPTIPVTMCPVGIYTTIAGTVSHIAGSSSFSLVTSSGGSHAFTQILNMNKVT